MQHPNELLCTSHPVLPSLFYLIDAQYADNIIGPGSPTYDNAYFEINYIRTYIGNTLIPPASFGPVSTTVIQTVSSTVFPSPSANTKTNAALSVTGLHHVAGLLAILAFFFMH